MLQYLYFSFLSSVLICFYKLLSNITRRVMK